MSSIIIILMVVLLMVVILILSTIKIVPQSVEYVVERLGMYRVTLGSGFHILIPFVDRVAKKISLKEQVKDFPPQPVITKDNVTIKVDTVVFFQVTDSKLFAYGVERPLDAILNLTATTLRNIIGDLELDQTLTSRETINNKITAILDEATNNWGIKVNRVELKNILPPAEIQDSMEKQMKAERERREIILRAEGEKRSQVLIAEGEKESTIIRAEAVKEQRIKEAEGEAKAIIIVNDAKAQGIQLLNASVPTDRVLALKSLETFSEVADGRATKIIIPSELQKMGGFLTSAVEMLKEDNIDVENSREKRIDKNEISLSDTLVDHEYVSNKESNDR